MNVVNKLQPKVLNTGLAAALVTVIVWGLSTYGHIAIPPEVSAALVTIISLIVGYFSPPVNAPTQGAS